MASTPLHGVAHNPRVLKARLCVLLQLIESKVVVSNPLVSIRQPAPPYTAPPTDCLSQVCVHAEAGAAVVQVESIRFDPAC